MLSLYDVRLTWLHRIPAGWKLLALPTVGGLMLVTNHLGWLLGLSATVVAFYATLGSVAWTHARRLRGVAVMATMVLAFHAGMGSADVGIVSALRLTTGVCLAAMYTLTTAFDDQLEILESLLQPLRRLGVAPERVALAVALALRFVDVFFCVWQRLNDAHRARMGCSGRMRLLAPLFIRVLQSADRVADALSARIGR